MNNNLQVAVAVILNQDGNVLISRRQAHQHQGDLWEFPGGKREKNETRLQALAREILEEVGLCVLQAEPWLKVVHSYAELQVELDVWLVTKFTGIASGKEGQTVEWCPVAALQNRDFPAANREIIDRLQGLLSD